MAIRPEGVGVFAPAKINLSLKILRRRSDGFHEIETVIAPISLCDQIKIEQRSGKQEIAFRCDEPSVPKGEDNIVVRAANAFFEETKITSGVSIALKKTIPHGAGLVPNSKKHQKRESLRRLNLRRRLPLRR